MNLVQIYNNAYKLQVPAKKKKSFLSRIFSSNEPALPAPSYREYIGGPDYIFGIKHYSGVQKTEESYKIYYDTSNFISSNSNYSNASTVQMDHIRLIKGGAEFSCSKNQFLLNVVNEIRYV